MSDRPLVSLILLAYKQEQFVRDAVRSALAQTYERLEIVLSDDASPDGTFEIMEDEAQRYNGPHRIILNRNPVNLGLVGNLNRAVRISSGDLLVMQAGDDISVPTRTSRLVQRWTATRPQPDLIYSHIVRIAPDGTALAHQDPAARAAQIEKLTIEHVIVEKLFVAGGCAAAYSRNLFDKYGPLHPDIQYEDSAFTFRALLENGCAFIEEPLVHYRIHDASIMQSIKNAQGTRRGAAERAKHSVAEQTERLRAWDISGKKDYYLRWRLARSVGAAKLDWRSSSGSRLVALGCLIQAIASCRPRSARMFLQRDILQRE